MEGCHIECLSDSRETPTPASVLPVHCCLTLLLTPLRLVASLEIQVSAEILDRTFSAIALLQHALRSLRLLSQLLSHIALLRTVDVQCLDDEAIWRAQTVQLRPLITDDEQSKPPV